MYQMSGHRHASITPGEKIARPGLKTALGWAVVIGLLTLVAYWLGGLHH